MDSVARIQPRNELKASSILKHQIWQKFGKRRIKALFNLPLTTHYSQGSSKTRASGTKSDPSPLVQNNGLSCRAPLLIKRPSKLNHLKAFSLFSTTLLAFSFHPSSKPCTVYLKKLGKSAKIMH